MVQEEKSNQILEQAITMNGYLKKIKSSKKRFLVLDDVTLCLQVYENHRIFRQGKQPYKSFNLTELLDVTRLSNRRYPYAFVLFLSDEKLSLAADSEEDLMKWINAIETSRRKSRKKSLLPEKSWNVAVKLKGIALTKHLEGTFKLCVTLNTCSLVDLHSDATMLSIPMWLIRKTGYTENVVFLELRENNFFLSNELWLDAETNETAENIHATFKSLQRPRTNTLLEQDTQTRFVPSGRTAGYCKSLCDADDFPFTDIRSAPSPYTEVTIDSTPYTEVTVDSTPYTEVTVDSDFGNSSSPASGISRSSSMEIHDSLTPNILCDDVFSFPPIIDENENELEIENSFEKHFINTNYVMHKSSTSSSFADDESEATQQSEACTGDYERYVNRNSFIHATSDSSLNQETESFGVCNHKERQLRSISLNEEHCYNFQTAISNQSDARIEKYVKMDPVKLVHFKTENTHFGEPFYESIKESRNSPLLGNKKYNVLSKQQPPLPKRNNQHNSSFYVKTEEYENESSYERVEEEKEKLKDGNERKHLDMIDRKKNQHRNGSYQEVKPKLRQTARSRSVDQSSLNRELVTIKFPNRKSDETLREEDEKPVPEDEKPVPDASHKVPSRSKSAPTKSTNFHPVEADVHSDDALDSEYAIGENTSYVNNEVRKVPHNRNVLHNKMLSGYEVMAPATAEFNNDELEQVTYDNIDSPSRISAALSYADIDLKKHYRNTFSVFQKNTEQERQTPEETTSVRKSRDVPIKYTVIDFEKSLGISQAVKGARPNVEDLSHKTFKK